MQFVPQTKLLIQPRVQLSWIEQHGWIQFQLEEALISRFQHCWQLMTSDGVFFKDYIRQPHSTEWQLEEDDSLFALLIGADWIKQKYPSFEIDTNASRLTWRISQ